MNRRLRDRRRGLWILTAVLAAGGCAGPMDRTFEQQFREQVMATSSRSLIADAGAATIEVRRAPSDPKLNLTPAQQTELDLKSGPTAYNNDKLIYGPDLAGKTGEESGTVNMSLEQAIQSAIKNNLQIKLLRLPPAANEAQITQALGAFDAVFFSNLDYSNLDTPTQQPLFAPPGAGPYTQAKTTTLTTGIRKELDIGGTISAQTVFDRVYNDPNYSIAPHQVNANVLVSITQPLLRNFGVDVTRAPIDLGISTRNQSIQDLRQGLMQVAADTEKAYWDLVTARQRLLIQQRLLQRTIDTRDRISIRERFDVSGIRSSEANVFVELRRREVINDQATVRLASDTLKQLLYDPRLPVAGEGLIVPIDTPADAPITYNLLDAVTTALRKRPEVLKAMMQIEDSAIRMRVADNLRLPKFDATAGIRFNGNAVSNLGTAYDRIVADRYVDYLAGFQFEAPIGNQAAEGLYEQRRLEREGAQLFYRKTAQDALMDVKNALRDIDAAYRAIGADRDARRMAAVNLRTIEDQEKLGVGLTPEFLLDLKLNSQQRLADSETQEMQDLASYNTAIANYFKATGTLLEHNNIDFKDPLLDKMRR